MVLAVAPEPRSGQARPGQARFIAQARAAEACADLRMRRFLVVGRAPTTPARGRLRETIDEAVEGALAMRGALPPCVSVDAEIGPAIHDQVFRVRALGMAGLALELPRLEGLVNDRGELSASDAATLGAWMTSAKEAPVVLLFDEADRSVRMLVPMPLSQLVGERPSTAQRSSHPRPVAAQTLAIEMTAAPTLTAETTTAQTLAIETTAAPTLTAETTTAPTALVQVPDAPTIKEHSSFPGSPAPASIAATVTAHIAFITEPQVEQPGPSADAALAEEDVTASPAPATNDAPPSPMFPPEAAKELESLEHEDVHQELMARIRARREARGLARDVNAVEASAVEAPTHEETSVAAYTETPRQASRLIEERVGARVRTRIAERIGAERTGVTERGAERTGVTERGAERTGVAERVGAERVGIAERDDAAGRMGAERSIASEREDGAERALRAAERRAFAIELDGARGPKPARVVDQLFATRYIPLLADVVRGEADGAVRSIVDAWRASFEHSYRESFATLRVTGKRPPMVFDAPDIAAKIGRINGARAVRLLLVDSMGFDLGERMMARLKERVASRAVCVEQSLLWAALPATTPCQMGLLARGAEGLREASPPGEPEPEIARGRAISTLRRERVGARELMKLDCVEARLRMAGPAYDERLDGIAEEVAQVIARFIEGLQPRTLLFVFGDHGFRMAQAPDGRSTSPATQGGASPEEVLVPGYAWLVGGVH